MDHRTTDRRPPHYFPQFPSIWSRARPSHGFEYKMVEGKGPQFKHGHLMTGPWGEVVDLSARLAARTNKWSRFTLVAVAKADLGTGAMESWLRAFSETYNDALARRTSAFPKAPGRLATLPMHRARAALKEWSAPRKCPACAALIAPRFVERYFRRFVLPVYERIEGEGFAAFLTGRGDRARASGCLLPHQSASATPFESAIAAAHLIFGGVLDRLPKLVVCLPHRAAPSGLVGPAQPGLGKRTDLSTSERSPDEYLRRFYSTRWATPTTYSNIWSGIGADRVLMGAGLLLPSPTSNREIVADHPTLDAEAKRSIGRGERAPPAHSLEAVKFWERALRAAGLWRNMSRIAAAASEWSLWTAFTIVPPGCPGGSFKRNHIMKKFAVLLSAGALALRGRGQAQTRIVRARHLTR